MIRSAAPRSHWADDVADEVRRAGRPAVLSTGISPSGEIHVGNLREVLTADAVFRVLRERGEPVRFNFVADNFDPLRRVYPFLDPQRYGARVGQPLSEIPCPCGAHASYAAHFLEPFLEALARLHVEVELERADELYKSGRMNPYIVRALEARERIAAILHELTGKQVEPDWSPFSPLCPACGRIHGVRVTGHDAARETVRYACPCGAQGERPLAGGGKLVWRIDWPARWCLLGVTVEPFGKDHATRGGSYDTGVRIVREIFEGQPPLPIPYEWIRLKGRGDMSSSRGNVLSVSRLVEVVPPEALRYLVMRERPGRTIDFDPGLPLLQLVDELDDAAAEGADARAVALSRAAGFRPVGVPFKHLVVVAQAAGFDVPRVLALLHGGGYGPVDEAALVARLEHVRRWLDEFAPEDMRFEVQARLPEAARALEPATRALLARLADGLRPGQDGEQVHRLIYETAAGGGLPPATLFGAIYLTLLGKTRGPRAGGLIALLGPEVCAARFREAASAG